MALTVIGAGFGRTGTLSLKAALEELGLGPCYHMSEAFLHPDHVSIWESAARGEHVDWARLFSGYHSTVDWPGAAFYEQLMHAYPEARVVLTVRDPDRWYDSARATIYGIGRAAASPLFRLLAPALPPVRGFLAARPMVEAVVWQGAFNGRFKDRHFAIRTFNTWNAGVRERVPADRLLVYEVTEGWGPLCRFLETPIPDTPFPHLNDAATFRRRIRRMQALSLAATALLTAPPVAVAAAVAAKRRASRA